MNAHLTTPQYIYLAAVFCYLLFFGLFLRLFWWKHYAETHYWRPRPRLTVGELLKRARKIGQALPRFSIVVPARNEADVIERTVEHMAKLQYPTDRYEVLVVTDEKEILSARIQHDQAVAGAACAIREGWGHVNSQAPESEADQLVLGLLGALALEGFEEVGRRLDRAESLRRLQLVPEVLLRPMIWEASEKLLQRISGKHVANRLLRLLALRLPATTQDEQEGAYAALLSLAIPAAVAFCSLRGGDGHALGKRLAVLAARAHYSLTREIIQSMCDALAVDLLDRLKTLGQSDRLEERLGALYKEIYPTTQDIMARKLVEFAHRANVPVLKHVVVPRDFDGVLGGRCLGVDVPSTKGRALNWALDYLDGRTTWCGFYDAESRPDPRSLLHVAHRVIEAKAEGTPPPRIFQGPVFQVRNWYEMGPFCKIASLYQAIAHDWYLPALFRRLPFVGGTNLYIETKLLKSIGGYDSSSLTEDLELGTRAYLKASAWPEYLPYPSSEQTPPTFAGFYRQRLRWATGHMQVMAKVRATADCDAQKKARLLKDLWLKGQGEWIFYQTATMVPPVVILLWALGLVDPNVLGPFWHNVMNLLSTVYLGFTIYAFFRYLEHLDNTARPRKWLGQLGALAQLLVLPLAAFLFPVPYSSALVLVSLGKGPSAWVKTPRTRE